MLTFCKKVFAAQALQVSCVLSLTLLSACEAADTETTRTPDEPAQPATSLGCGKSGALDAELFGSLETAISWSGSEFTCESMQRPNNDGVRLRFSGHIDSETLVLIIAIPGLEKGATGGELPSTVTANVEGTSRFFSTPNMDACWADVHEQAAVPGNSGRFKLSGTLYCVSPLGEINGDAAVSIPELRFSTLLDWGA